MVALNIVAFLMCLIVGAVTVKETPLGLLLLVLAGLNLYFVIDHYMGVA